MPERTVVDHSLEHPAWDRFVADAPGGGYLQTARWARVKSVVGFDALRLILQREGQIVGGCQLLIRRLPAVGAVAYAPRGPLLAEPSNDALERLLVGLRALAVEHRIGYLKAQLPPGAPEALIDCMGAHGFVPSDAEVAPTATTRVRLTGRSADDLRAGMRSTTRRRLRQAERSDIEIRAGDEADLPALQSLLEATASRQGFEPYRLRYHQAMWREFAPDGGVRLLFAEREGHALAASLLIGFGDTLVHKVGGWDHSRGAGRPNELLHWHGICWAQHRGFTYYDFEGVNLAAAQALRRGEPLPEEASGVTFFKLGFGGEVAIFPPACDLMLPTLLGTAMRHVGPRLTNLRRLTHLVAGRGR